MYIHIIINVALPIPFLHLIFIVSNGLLNQKIISTSFFSKKLCMVPYFLCSLYICLVVRPLSTTLESKPSTLLKCDLHIGIFVIEIQGQVLHGLDYHFNECALDDTKQCPQHLDTLTSVSHKTWPCTLAFLIWDTSNHHGSPLVQSCNDIYMHTKHNVIDFNMLYPHRFPFQVHLFPCDYIPMMTNVTINCWPFQVLWLVIVSLYEFNWCILVFYSLNVFSYISPWYVTSHDIHYIPKTLVSFGHQNKSGHILHMNNFWAYHGVL